MKTPDFTESSSRLLSTKEAARRLNLTPVTLARWRVKGGGPPFIKMYPGNAVRYSHTAIDDFIKANRRLNTSQGKYYESHSN